MRKHIRRFAILSACACLLCVGSGTARADHYVDRYRVVWNSPSRDAGGSMPVGGGSLQLNTWCEQNDILFYIGSTDCRMDNSFTLGKLGRVRVRFYPNPFEHTFRQELNLKESEVVYTGDNGFRFTLSTGIEQPVVFFQADSKVPVRAEVIYETWNHFRMELQADQVFFYYANDTCNDLLQQAIRDQKVESFRELIPDPVTGSINGGILTVEGMQPAGRGSGTYMNTDYESCKLESVTPTRRIEGRVAVRIAQDASVPIWKEEVGQVDRYAAEHSSQIAKERKAWWREFWDRSYIVIEPEVKDTTRWADRATREAWEVGRNYQLFRYMLGCASRNTLPVLFNGGIFNVDSPSGPPERRMWDGCEFMAQNQRLVYWPMLKSGDFDLMRPALDMYNRMLPLQLARSRKFWNIEGAAFPEALMVYGLNGVYGDPTKMTDCFGRCPDRPRTEDGHSGLIHLEYHYTSMLDFAYMALNYVEYGGGKLADYLPFIENAVRFFDNYYQKRSLERNGSPLVDGKLVLYPASALELYAGAKNPTDVVCGLHMIVRRLLEQADLPQDRRSYFEALEQRLPDVPVTQVNGHKVLPPAESWELEGSQGNMEFPQLYSLFPFDYYTLESPDLDIPKNTWLYNSKAAAQKNYICWFQGGIYTARLGLTDEAKSYAVRKFLHPTAEGCHPGVPANRFPAFWPNPGFCHTPDIDHGGAAMVGLQDMLMQVIDGRIYLAPAWPKEWNCRFKLHAPQSTVVQGDIRDGKVENLKVFPASRRSDIVLP